MCQILYESMFLIIKLIKFKWKTEYNQNIIKDINYNFLKNNFIVLINWL